MNTPRELNIEFLRETHRATDSELNYLNSVYQLRQKTPEDTTSYWQPSQLLDSWLFQGTWEQANDSVLLNRLAITHIINVTERKLQDSSRQVLHIRSKEGALADLSGIFSVTNSFIDSCYEQGQRVFVHCRRGISRSSTITLAYLMHHKQWTLLQAFEYLLTKRCQAMPDPILFLQLIRYECTLRQLKDEK